MKLNSEVCYTVEIKVQTIPSYYHTITADVIAESVVDAFATAREVAKEMYQYNDDCIVSENLIGEKAVYRMK